MKRHMGGIASWLAIAAPTVGGVYGFILSRRRSPFEHSKNVGYGAAVGFGAGVAATFSSGLFFPAFLGAALAFAAAFVIALGLFPRADLRLPHRYLQFLGLILKLAFFGLVCLTLSAVQGPPNPWVWIMALTGFGTIGAAGRLFDPAFAPVLATSGSHLVKFSLNRMAEGNRAVYWGPDGDPAVYWYRNGVVLSPEIAKAPEAWIRFRLLVAKRTARTQPGFWTSIVMVGILVAGFAIPGAMPWGMLVPLPIGLALYSCLILKIDRLALAEARPSSADGAAAVLQGAYLSDLRLRVLRKRFTAGNPRPQTS